ncbi:hypothetical protein GCM10020331_014210 [Ectobacillus funiculus]
MEETVQNEAKAGNKNLRVRTILERRLGMKKSLCIMTVLALFFLALLPSFTYAYSNEAKHWGIPRNQDETPPDAGKRVYFNY